MTPEAFLEAVGPAARTSQCRTAIPASITLAQAALESGWGRSQLAREGCNLFGVKADKSWRGATLILPTKEFVGDRWQIVEAIWRKYPDWEDAIDDHARFFYLNPRYHVALRQVRDAHAFARALQICGYATDPHYAEKLWSVVQSRRLTQYDAPESEWALLPEYARRIA